MNRLDNLFEIKNLQHSNSFFNASVIINPQHEVFKGHFPGFPLTPAVIQIYFINAILNQIHQKEWVLMSSPKTNFLKIINPGTISEINISGTYQKQEDILVLNAQGTDNEDVLFKFSGKFRALDYENKNLSPSQPF